MATYQPYQGYATAYNASLTNAMREVWDPVIYPTAFRAGDLTKFFNPNTKPWPKGKKYHVRVETVMLNTARYFGTPFYESGGVGRLLPNPANKPEYDEWQVAHTDLMGMSAGVRWAWPTQEIADENDISNLAENLSRQSLQSIATAIERGLVGRQTGQMGAIKALTDSLEAYSTSSGAYTDAATTARIWLDRTPVHLTQGDVIDIVSRAGSTAYKTGVVVKNVGMENPASGVYGYIDVDGSAATSSSFDKLMDLLEASTPSAYIFMSGEYSTSFVPEAVPAATTNANTMYGMLDWFRSETGAGIVGRSPGAIYNVTRTTAGYQWAVPICLDKYVAGTGNTTISMDHIDELLLSIFHKHLNQPNLTNLVIGVGPKMMLELTKLTNSVNRRVDGTTAARQSIVTNYGFDGLMIHHPVLGTPVAIQLVRGWPEDTIIVFQPGFCELIQPGGVQWLDWGNGSWFQNEVYSDGAQGGTSRTLVYRGDRVAVANSLIRVPRLAGGALLGVKPA